MNRSERNIYSFLLFWVLLWRVLVHVLFPNFSNVCFSNCKVSQNVWSKWHSSRLSNDFKVISQQFLEKMIIYALRFQPLPFIFTNWIYSPKFKIGIWSFFFSISFGKKKSAFFFTTRVSCQRTRKNFNDIILETNNLSFLHPIKIFIFSMKFVSKYEMIRNVSISRLNYYWNIKYELML